MYTLFRVYWVPIVGALLMHVLIYFVFFFNWDLKLNKTQFEPKLRVVNASLVEIKKPKTKPKKAVQAKPKPAPKKPAVKSKPKPKPKPVEKEVTPEKPKEVDKVNEAREKRLAAELALSELLADEEAENQAAYEAGEIDRYLLMMRGRIASFWNRPPSARNGMELTIVIRMIPSGEILDYNIIHSSGNEALDRSAEVALQKVGQFEFLREMPTSLFDKNFRTVTFKFRPEDLKR